MGRLVRLDWAIKKILRDKANFEILEGFLSELLCFDVLIQEVLLSKDKHGINSDESNRTDLLVRNQAGDLFIIQIRNELKADYLQRLVSGTSDVLVKCLHQRELATQVKKVYSVSIIHFDLGPGDDYLYHGSTTFKGLHKSGTLTLDETQKRMYAAPTGISSEYYLIKVPKFNNVITDTLDEWIFFLKNEGIQEGFRAKGLQAAKEKLDILKLDPEERRRYESYLEDLHYHASMMLGSFQEGELKGELIGQIKLLRKLKQLPPLSRETFTNAKYSELQNMLDDLESQVLGE